MQYFMRNVESTVFFSCYVTETIFYHKGTWLKVYWINVKYNIIAEKFFLTGILLHQIFRLKPDSKLGHILISVNWTGLCPERVKTWWFMYLNKIQDVHLYNATLHRHTTVLLSNFQVLLLRSANSTQDKIQLRMNFTQQNFGRFARIC